jgi:hypothetical protein
MRTCEMSVYLAYAMAVYCLGSVYYLFSTRALGTPFRDSLTAKQLAIKAKAVSERKGIFMQGLAVATLVMVATRPFSACGGSKSWF